MSEMNRKLDGWTVLLLGVAAILLLVAATRRFGGSTGRAVVLTTNSPKDSQLVAWAAHWRATQIDPTSFFKLAAEGDRVGRPETDVTIVVFSSFACGHCVAFESTLSRLRDKYPDHLAVVYRHFLPLMDRGVLRTHLAAECAADQGKFPEFSRIAFRNTLLMTTRDGWLKVADSAKVGDLPRFVGCTKSEADRQRIVRNNEEGTKLGVTGTPTSFINGYRVVGEIPFESLDSLVAFELDRLRPKPRG